MPYIEEDAKQDVEVERQRRRWALTGGPERGKTTSLLTFKHPIAIVSCPDELGFGSIPKHAHEGGVATCLSTCPRWQVDVFLFGAVDAVKPDWIGTIEETRRLMADLVIGKKTWRDQRYKTVAVDGWHKLYPVYLNLQSGGRLAKGESFDGRKIYPTANALFFNDARRWCQSDVEWLIFTMWVERDSDDPNDPTASTHFFPALSGKAGQNVVGEIGITLAAERQGTGGAARYIWLTQPDTKYWGVGCHLPLELAAKLPPSVPQRWEAITPYLGLSPIYTSKDLGQ